MTGRYTKKSKIPDEEKTFPSDLVLPGIDNLAFATSELFFIIEKCQDGYDYSLYDHQYNLLDRNILRWHSAPIWEAARRIIKKLSADFKEAVVIDYEVFLEELKEAEDE